MSKLQQILILFAIVTASASGCASTARLHEQPVSVFLVRHAEKSTDHPKDPSLSATGHARASQLAEMLGSAGVTHLFASEYKRTQQTLAPLAQTTARRIVVISARDPDAQVAALRRLAPGSVAVVAGHSNTVPGLARALGAPIPNLSETAHGRMLDENEYDRLFLVTLGAARDDVPQLVELRYGVTH